MLMLMMNRLHLVTAYDILRMKGVDVGKFDYLNGSNVFEQEDMQE